MDLRLVLINEDKLSIDGCTGGMAKKATVNKNYKTKLKSTIATKCHIDSFIRELPFLRARDVPLIKMPIVQIAGFDGKLSVLSLSNKKEYKLEEVSSFCFPHSLQQIQQIQQGSLENLINVLATIDVR